MIDQHPTRTSKRQARGDLYSAAVRVAAPGDVVFFISDLGPATSLPLWSRLYRRWLGFAPSDTTMWHTAIYTGSVKEKRSKWVRPHIIHAAWEGVAEEHLPPSYFTSVRSERGAVVQTARIEIVRYDGLTDEQRGTIVEYCRAQLGKPFADLGWRHDFLTYAFGLPSPRQDPGKVSCHGLAFQAYEQAGVTFPHQLRDVPSLNLARLRGHPLGHPADRADLSRLYLRDHHLYRDPRFSCVLAAFDDLETRELKVVENPGKYSWNRQLLDRAAS